jgi:NAD(P)-dependent dehydrogenase (short-subunit alcohol dehydrogenase family)
MRNITLDPSLLHSLAGKTAIVTGAAGGIGSAITRLLLEHGANVVMADLEYTRATVQSTIASLPDSTTRERVQFVATDITVWDQMTALFRAARERFGPLSLVVANAGVMESEGVLDVEGEGAIDEAGNLREARDFATVIDVNVKGTMNCLRLALFAMKGNDRKQSQRACFADGSRGAVVLVSSVSGYFGGTGVAGYVSSKHAVTGMLRASQRAARRYGVRVHAVAPFVTPTAMAGGFSHAWRERGLPINTTERVAAAVLALAVDARAEAGSCYMVCSFPSRPVEVLVPGTDLGCLL